ncbi:uncharacterized protein UTRI_10095 [Ustilago trichophora]|uniref:Zn(2)-C6 fungal-type domain-containing protein n=1 Tax=Ustilago trichophora TaxID=86804 RepID=A0A5C3E3M0_9BASI|nr:uncharacterized protein UTRI_10095 [Ustilago trichophora]
MIPMTSQAGFTNTTDEASSSTTNNNNNNNKRLVSRRVPDGKRQRTSVSCDRCKQRRMKCSRSKPDSTCLNCSKLGLECTWALPRKHRIHGSIESLSWRYRALEALVRGLTHQDIHQTQALVDIARHHHIDLPSLECSEYEPRAFAHIPPPLASTSSHSHSHIHTTSSTRPDSRLGSASAFCASCAATVVPLDIPDGKLIPAPHGISHYVGSASSFEFANAVRRLVAKVDRLNTSTSGSIRLATSSTLSTSNASPLVSTRPLPLPSHSSSAQTLAALSTSPPTTTHNLRAEFATSMQTSKALEPRDRTHPAAAAAAIDDSASVESDDQVEHAPASHPKSPQYSSVRTRPPMPPSSPPPQDANHNPSSASQAYNLAAQPVPSTIISTCTSDATHANHSIPELATPDSTRSLRTRRLPDMLPSKATSDRLVDAFFDRVHPNYVVFHRGLFYRQYRSIWRQPDRQNNPQNRSVVNDADTGWICSLFMVLVFGAQALEGQGLPDALQVQRRYLRLVVRERFQRLAFTASLSNVQALLLLQLYEHNAGERNAAWMLLGQAARMAIALGMHREIQDSSFDTVEQNLRRLVWWTLQQFEMNLSMALGRPSSLELVQVTANVPEEAIMDRNDFPPDYPEYYRRLIDISCRAKQLLARTSARHSNEHELLGCLAVTQEVLGQLESWHSQLPSQLSPDWPFAMPRQCRAVLLLLINYNHICATLARPFLLCKIQHEIEQVQNQRLGPLSPDIAQLASAGLRSARSVLEMCEQLHQQDMLEGVVWLDCYYLHHAMLICSLPYLLPSSQLERSPHDVELQALLARTSAICKNLRLAPTYLVLTKIATQLVRIVGIDDGAQNVGPPEGLDTSSRLGLQAATTAVNSFQPSPRYSRTDPGQNPSINSLDLLLAAAQVPMQPYDRSTYAWNDPVRNDAHASSEHHAAIPVQSNYTNNERTGSIDLAHAGVSPNLHNLLSLETSPDAELYSEFYQLGFETGSTCFTWDFFNVGGQGPAATSEQHDAPTTRQGSNHP